MSKKKNKIREQEPVTPGASQPEPTAEGTAPGNVLHLNGMYENWFLDYASYVILERAVPNVNDGLKPVQRRLLHSMYDLEDGRYNKVANLIGHTMKYHPHGDASIGDALVQMGQKDLLIDMQGNWGNILTGDSAAAPRYIEARLSKFALEVLFSPKVTEWQLSYDGRNKEPVELPVKFPLLLAQGAEGIAVGLACKILPHNFNELIDACVGSLRGRKPNILPDFPTGGLADFSDYNEGKRGGRIKVRARINQLNRKTLSITEVPFGTTTSSLIDSIVAANEKGKIKIRKIEDNTADTVEILIHLSADVSPEKTIDALYAFTDCELSISPNACVIEKDKPRFLGVNEMLKIAADNTQEILKKELEIRKKELEEQLFFSSLEKIFIEKRIYRNIEECKTWEDVLAAIDKGLRPYKKNLLREVTQDDLVRLTEIRIKRISKFDSFKADEEIKNLEDEIKQVKHNLRNIVDYAVDYFKELKKKYGTGRERKTEIKSFAAIVATQVAAANVKLYVNREEGFAGTGMRKDEFVCDCSDLDDIIVFRGDGTMVVKKISDKDFVGKEVMHIAVFKKNDERTIYNMVYRDGLRGDTMMKRFAVTGVTRDKPYNLTVGTEGTRVFFLSANPNGEGEIVTVHLKPAPKLKKPLFDIDFSKLAIKNRSAIGNIATKHSVKKVVLKKKGESTLGAQKIWFDDTVHRLNTAEQGMYLGEFSDDDKIFSITQSGNYRLTGFDVSTHFDDDVVLIEKFNPKKLVTAVYLEGKSEMYFVKRFEVEVTDRKVPFISDTEGSRIELATTEAGPVVEVSFYKHKGHDIKNQKIDLSQFIEVMGLKAKGSKLSDYKIKEIDLIASSGGEEKPASAKKEKQKEEAGGKDKKKKKDSAIKKISSKEVKGKSQMKLF